jgi:hypothetical protein
MIPEWTADRGCFSGGSGSPFLPQPAEKHKKIIKTMIEENGRRIKELVARGR